MRNPLRIAERNAKSYHPCNYAVKYAGDPLKLRKELDLKFIEGDADGAKGLAQISKHLYRFFNGEKLGDLSSADVDRVFPIMVCLENTMVVPYVGRYLNEQFRGMLPRRGFRQVVTPVFILGFRHREPFGLSAVLLFLGYSGVLLLEQQTITHFDIQLRGSTPKK